MKHIFLRIATVSVLFVAFSNFCLSANKIKTPKTISFYSPLADDANLVLTYVNNEGHMDAHISFNGNEGTTGTVKIFNANNQLVNAFEINLIPSPNFSIINLNEYAAGVYSFELTTGSGVHTSHLTIQ